MELHGCCVGLLYCCVCASVYRVRASVGVGVQTAQCWGTILEFEMKAKEGGQLPRQCPEGQTRGKPRLLGFSEAL